jgi:peptidoglycan/LPS O-acetylase OafA/YrhL/lysophospholipase L1-like esterase
VKRRYQPELDGLRGLAVALVVLFHLGFSWMPGGYVGVSLFFTLSGYLISRLLLDEFDAEGSVGFGRFYARRARRLLPAAQVLLILVVVARVAGEFEYVEGLSAELWGSLAQVANWVHLAGASSYAALFEGSVVSVSPVAHFWSLAIEEQFYLLWPVTLVVLARAATRRGVALWRVVLFAFAVSAVVTPLIGVWWGRDAVYWATPARLGELLAGAVLATWQRDRVRAGRGLPLDMTTWGWPALAAVLAAAVTWPSGSGPGFAGWFPVFAVASTVLVASLLVPGALARAFAARPLAWLGRISYGLYLVHWPVFLVLRRHGWELDQPVGALVAVALAVLLAQVSFVVLERPVREARWDGRRTGVLAVTAVAVTAVAIALMPPTRSLLGGKTAAMEAASIRTVEEGSLVPLVTTASSSASTSSGVPSVLPTSTDPSSAAGATLALPDAPVRPVRILVVGDSTAFAMGRGLATWAVAHPDHAEVDVLWAQGLGFVLDGRITTFDGASFVARSAEVVRTELPALIERLRPDVVVMMSTVDDVADREWTPAEGPLAPTDPRFGARLRSQYRAATRIALDAGAPRVVWVVAPIPANEFSTADLNVRESHLAVHAAIREVAASVPGASVAEMDEWLTATGHATDDEWRPDGTHLSEQAALRLAEEWFGPWLVGESLRPLP